MKRQTRYGVFETNSSSTHSLTVCSEEEFEAWKRGEVLFRYWSEEFINPVQLSDKQKKEAEKDYERNRSIYWKDWEDLSDDEKEKWYNKYTINCGLTAHDAKTYAEYMYNDRLETFEEHYTSKSGDKLVIFGNYGYDG